ncbi:MAG: serine/threonine-protein kinase, partial [Polyangia bacterium]
MFGKYALLRPFARGGMGEICLAAHGELGGLEKLCLVKKVLQIDDQPSLAARLLDEAKVAVRLNHANLVQVFDAGKVDDELYIAMELIEGRDLRAVWNRTAERRSRIPLDVALYVVREMARGLEYAHNYGGLNLVHRDIAPPNILLSWHGEVKITDFGLARSTLKSEQTAPGIVYGRIAYLAPEQARGEQADKRTDVYAVGVILWELLTGRPLHETTDEAVKNLEMARHPRIEKPSNFARGITPSLDAVVLKALSATREDRYQTADELRRGLAEELARIAPTTDASRLSSWLSEQFEDVVKSEAIEHERLLREELPLLRLRSSAMHAAAKTPVARAQSLDLRIAGVDRDELDDIEDHPRPSGVAPTLAAAAIAPTVQRPLPGIRPGDTRAGVAPLRPTPQQPTVSLAGQKSRGFDEDQETRVQAARNKPANRSHSVAAAARAVAHGEDDTLAPDELVGEIIDGRYRIERLLGTGGMGAVYEAEHIGIGKKVALKVLHPQFSRQADLVQRFRREALAASKVGHPNIVDVTDSGTTDHGDAYFVMERLDGTDLADVLRHERRLAIDRTIAVGAQICRALQAAHQAGIIHRDLKPENIFLVSRDGQPDFVKVLDFGIAKSEDVAQVSRRLTTPGIAMGTPEYMAPEQAAGKPVDGRVDIYSVGAILYEMLAGEPPHSGTSVMDILAKKATQPPEPLHDRNPSVPEALEHLIMSALERDPAARPQTMSQLEYELNKCLKGRGSAVAAVLGIRTNDDGAWSDEGSRTGMEAFFGPQTGRHSVPISL